MPDKYSFDSNAPAVARPMSTPITSGFLPGSPHNQQL